jgi:hypothetical protein
MHHGKHLTFSGLPHIHHIHRFRVEKRHKFGEMTQKYFKDRYMANNIDVVFCGDLIARVSVQLYVACGRFDGYCEPRSGEQPEPPAHRVC